MKIILRRLSLTTILLVLLASCSSLEPDEDEAWGGSWIYESDTARLEATLDQRGNRLVGRLEQVFTHDARPSVTHYTVEATIGADTATGHLLVDNTPSPVKIIRQGEAITLEVAAWSWMPVLSRVQP